MVGEVFPWWGAERMWGAEKDPSRSTRGGFPVEVVYRLRLEGGAGSGCFRQRIGMCKGPETKEDWNILGRGAALRKPPALCAFLTA